MIGLISTSNDDGLVKAIFDHVRNVAICAAVFAAAAASNAHPPISLAGTYVWTFSTALLFAVGGWLFLVNLLHGIGKMQTAGVRFPTLALIGTLYGAATAILVLSVVYGRLGR